MEFKKRLTQLAQSAGTLMTQPGIGAPNSVLAPLRKLGWPAPFKPTAAAIEAYQAVIADQVALIDRLPTKYRKDAQEVVWDSVMKGYDAAGLARELHDRFGIVPERAQLIAGTQCKMARAVIDNAEHLESGITQARWRYDSDRCQLPTHRTLAGKRYPLSQGANLDGKWIWPSSEPRCFCTAAPITAPEKA